MLEVLIARLVLHEPERSWERLQAIEGILQDLWPGSRQQTGALGNPLAVSVADWDRGQQAQPEEIREFLVRGQVTKARRTAPLSALVDRPAIALLQVFYPEPGVGELNRVSEALRSWPGDGVTIEFHSVRHPGIPQDETVDTEIMQFEIRRPE